MRRTQISQTRFRCHLFLLHRSDPCCGTQRIFAVILSVLFAVYSVFSKFVLHQNPKGFTALIFVNIFLSGFLLLFLGIIGEYVGRIYEEVKGRPIYIIQKRIGPKGRSLQ